jgi:hypothetical protein
MLLTWQELQSVSVRDLPSLAEGLVQATFIAECQKKRQGVIFSVTYIIAAHLKNINLIFVNRIDP